MVFRSTAFPERIGGRVVGAGGYRLGLSSAEVGRRISDEFGLPLSATGGGWEACFEMIEGYATLHRILSRVSSIARVLHQEGVREFAARLKVIPGSTEAVREVVQRVGQDVFRQALIAYWGGRCAVTGLTLAEVLRASHIKPWAECETDEERLDVFNGLLLAPHLDALFDKGLITFSDDGRMIYSRQLEYEHRQRLGLDDRLLRNVPLSDRHLKYLAWHRSKVFRGDVQTE